jgi:protocatechuate 3,4-dioxygenase beta subunit
MANALLDFWQANTNGVYDNTDTRCEATSSLPPIDATR